MSRKNDVSQSVYRHIMEAPGDRPLTLSPVMLQLLKSWCGDGVKENFELRAENGRLVQESLLCQEDGERLRAVVRGIKPEWDEAPEWAEKRSVVSMWLGSYPSDGGVSFTSRTAEICNEVESRPQARAVIEEAGSREGEFETILLKIGEVEALRKTLADIFGAIRGTVPVDVDGVSCYVTPIRRVYADDVWHEYGLRHEYNGMKRPCEIDVSDGEIAEFRQRIGVSNSGND